MLIKIYFIVGIICYVLTVTQIRLCARKLNYKAPSISTTERLFTLGKLVFVFLIPVFRIIITVIILFTDIVTEKILEEMKKGIDTT